LSDELYSDNENRDSEIEIVLLTGYHDSQIPAKKKRKENQKEINERN